MKRVIIHVGPHKTGSSYLQKTLKKNIKLLMESNVVYPNIYHSFNGHHLLVNDLNDKTPVRKIRDMINKNFEKNDVCILSSENFSELNEPALTKLKKSLQGLDVRFIYYTRAPSARLRSLWQESIKHGGTISFPSFFFNILKKPSTSISVNPSFFLNRIANIFGKDTIRLIDYENASLNNSIISFFWKGCDLDQVLSDTDERVNVMMDIAEVELLRFLNYYGKQDGTLENDNIRILYFQNRKRLIARILKFSKLIKNYEVKYESGNFEIDNMVRKNLNNNWIENYVNDISDLTVSKTSYLNEFWVVNDYLKNIALGIYDFIVKPIKYRNKTVNSSCANLVEKRVFGVSELFYNLDRHFNNNKMAYVFRDLALFCEENDEPRIAYFFMNEAKKIKPNGPLIIKKLDEYSKKLSIY